MTTSYLERVKFDALVAERVFDGELEGYEVEPGFCGFAPGIRAKDVFAPKRFSSDISADYAVLVHVRTKWSDIRQYEFGQHLWDIMECHSMLGSYLGTHGFYEPGDYARAALKAVGAEVQG